MKEEYTEINEIPRTAGRATKYPYDEWAAIPEGKAIEVTGLFDCVKPASFYSAVTMTSKVRGLGITVMCRGDRIWVAKPQSKPTP